MTQAASKETGGYTRPGSIEDLGERMSRILTPEGAAMLAAFQPEPDDVFIVTPAKCGTTWMQQIVQGLRSGGAMDFDNINDVVPWLGITHLDEDAARAGQGQRPHAFKSHAVLTEVPRGAKYIVVLREPAAAVVSSYRFCAGAFLDPDRLDFETFAQAYADDCPVHQHVLASWPRRRVDDVRIYCYESMLADLPTTVESVAAFLDIQLTPQLCEVVVSQASLAFMKAHESKFDDTVLFESFRERMELPPTESLSKVAPDESARPRVEVSQRLRAELDAAWRRDVTPATGLATYAELRTAVDRLDSR
jgi:hypothetical protein